MPLSKRQKDFMAVSVVVLGAALIAMSYILSRNESSWNAADLSFYIGFAIMGLGWVLVWTSQRPRKRQ